MPLIFSSQYLAMYIDIEHCAMNYLSNKMQLQSMSQRHGSLEENAYNGALCN